MNPTALPRGEIQVDRLGLPSAKSMLVRLFTDRELQIRGLRYSLGLPTPLRTPDRQVLERIIFPHYLSLPNMRSILFIGVSWYTKHYQEAYFHGLDFWTLDVDKKVRRFGGSNHVTGAMEDLRSHFADGYFDLIICNGVYGHGLNSKDQCERAFEGCYACDRAGGYFMLGWNDFPENPGAPLDSIESLRRFHPEPLPQLGTWRYRVDAPARHVYDFYRKDE